MTLIVAPTRQHPKFLLVKLLHESKLQYDNLHINPHVMELLCQVQIMSIPSFYDS